MTTAEEAIKSLSLIKDSGSGKSLVDLGWIDQIRVNSPRITFRLDLPNFAYDQRDRIAKEAKSILSKFGDINDS